MSGGKEGSDRPETEAGVPDPTAAIPLGPGERGLPVANDEAGARLDAFVSRRLGVSVGEARRRIDAGLVRVDGRRQPKGAPVTVGARVAIAAADQALVADEARAVAFIYEDPALIAIDKPAGMPSHPLRAGERGTAANAIVARHPECATASEDPREGGLGHRLDTATSGVLVAARNRVAWVALRAALGAADCQKRYLAEVWGHPPDDGHVTASIGRRGRRSGKVRLEGGRGSLPAETRWRVLGRRPETSLLEARLHAGRAHQVRVHLAAAGFPIVGDDRYDDRYDDRFDARSPTLAVAAPASERTLHLHAATVSFTHPVTGKPLTIEAPPPLWARSEAAR